MASPLRASAGEKTIDGASSAWQRPASTLRTSAPIFLFSKDRTVPASASDQAPADQPGETSNSRQQWIDRHDRPSFTFDECPIESINALAAEPASPTRDIPAGMPRPGKSEQEKRLTSLAGAIKAMIENEVATVLKALMQRPVHSSVETQKLNSARAAFSRFMQQFNKAKQEAQNGKAQETASAVAEAALVLKSFIENDYKIIADLISKEEKSSAGKKDILQCLRQIESACSQWAGPAPEKRNRSASSPASPIRPRTEPGKPHKRPLSMQLPSPDKAQPWDLHAHDLDAQPDSPRATGRERNSLPSAPLTGSAATGMALASPSSAPAQRSPLSTDTSPINASNGEGAIGTADVAPGSNQASAGDAERTSKLLQDLDELDSVVDQWLG
jgi:hypothetical protein